MKVNKGDIERILSKIRYSYVNEFESSRTEGVSMEALENEVDYLISKFEDLLFRQNELVNNVENHLIENKYEPFEYSERGDQIDVIAMSFNTYIEELRSKMISKDYFQEIFNEIPLNVLILDEHQKVENANRSGIQFFNISGSFDEQNFEASFNEQLINLLHKFYNSKNLKTEDEIEFYKNNTEKIYLFCTFLKIQLTENSHVLFISKDITEDKKQQMQLLKATIEGQEMERKRLAIEIHDSLGQELSSLKMNINSIQNVNPSTERYHEVMLNLDEIIRNAVQTVKDITFNLKPSLLTTLNLRAAILRLIDVMSHSTLKITLNCADKELKLKNYHDELFVYRVIQEFLNNSFKHAAATLITIVVRKNTAKKQYKITLSDNGIGFDLKDKRTSKGNGIVNIYHRLKILNADFTFDSIVGKGTSLEFYISY